MSSMSNYLRNALGDHALGTAEYTMPATVYIAAYTDIITAADSGTEVDGGSYARQSIAFDALVGGEGDNTSSIEFPQATTDWGTVHSIGLRDAATEGNLLFKVPLGAKVGPFLGNASNDTITCYGHGLTDGTKVTVEGEYIGGGLAEDTIYYVRDATTDTFKLATTDVGTAINITANCGGIIRRLAPKTIDTGDILRIPAGAFDVLFR